MYNQSEICVVVHCVIYTYSAFASTAYMDMDNGYVRRMYSDVCSKLAYGDVYVYVYVNCTVCSAQSWLG